MEELEEVPNSLTDRPLFIHLLAILYLENEKRGGKGLPTKRGTLIQDTIELLLGRWTEPRLKEDSLLVQLNCTEQQLYERLENIAYKIHSKGRTSDEAPAIDLEIILVE